MLCIIPSRSDGWTVGTWVAEKASDLGLSDVTTDEGLSDRLRVAGILRRTYFEGNLKTLAFSAYFPRRISRNKSTSRKDPT